MIFDKWAFTFHAGAKTWPNISLKNRCIILTGTKTGTMAQVQKVCGDKIREQVCCNDTFFSRKDRLGMTEIRLETLEANG